MIADRTAIIKKGHDIRMVFRLRRKKPDPATTITDTNIHGNASRISSPKTLAKARQSTKVFTNPKTMPKAKL
jgi:hypothetical protein